MSLIDAISHESTPKTQCFSAFAQRRRKKRMHPILVTMASQASMAAVQLPQVPVAATNCAGRHTKPSHSVVERSTQTVKAVNRCTEDITAQHRSRCPMCLPAESSVINFATMHLFLGFLFLMMPLINATVSIAASVAAFDVSCVLISPPGVDNDDAWRIIINTAFSTGQLNTSYDKGRVRTATIETRVTATENKLLFRPSMH